MVRYEVQGARAEVPGMDGEQGFMLLGLIVGIAIIMLFLGVAASDAAFSLRRDKELESARRADQYFRAIRLFYMKNNHYPGSIEQLENTNNIRYLRKQYVDPLTGNADYRLIVVGQNKTSVKGFFGEPLSGLETQSMGHGDILPGGKEGNALGGPAGKAPGETSLSQTSSVASPQGGSGLEAAKGPIMGVGSSASGPSILTFNEETSYEKWEFLYDPRVEQLRMAAALNSGMETQHPLNDNATMNTQH